MLNSVKHAVLLNTEQGDMWVQTCVYVCPRIVGGADGGFGEDTPGAGHHQAASVHHSAVPA